MACELLSGKGAGGEAVARRRVRFSPLTSTTADFAHPNVERRWLAENSLIACCGRGTGLGVTSGATQLSPQRTPPAVSSAHSKTQSET